MSDEPAVPKIVTLNRQAYVAPPSEEEIDKDINENFAKSLEGVVAQIRAGDITGGIIMCFNVKGGSNVQILPTPGAEDDGRDFALKSIGVLTLVKDDLIDLARFGHTGLMEAAAEMENFE